MYCLNKNLPLDESYDVIVCGGGPAGCTAAIAAAREGAKTLLLESSAMLGGMATLGMVNNWGPIHDGIRNLHQGIAGEIIVELRAAMPNTPQDKWNHLSIDPEKLKLILDRRVTESGATVLFHSFVTGVQMKDDRNIDVILVANKAGLTAYRAKVFIDCTGDADLYAWAGKEYAKGDEEGNLQPVTMCFMVSGIDEEKFKVMDDPYYDGTGYKKHALLHKIMAEGKYDIPDDHIVYRQMTDGTYTYNAGHVYQIDATDPASFTRGCIEGRKRAWAIKNAYTEYADAYKDSYMAQTAPCVGLRESRRIVGDYTFVLEDYLLRNSFPDEICRGRYAIDVHEERPDIIRDTTQIFERYKTGESYGVPYRILCPRDLDNVLVAGRTVSCDRLSNGSLRVMPCCMNEGEAAGIAAKLAGDMEQVNIHRVDTQILRRRLMEEGAFLPKLPTDTF